MSQPEVTVTVLVVDDQTMIREALTTMLDLMPGLRVLGSAANGAEAIEAVREHEPQVVLMDLDMPVMGGVEATGRLTALFPEVAVVVLTTLADDDAILAALGAGARGYLTKQSGRADIARAVQAAAAGQAVLDPAVQLRLIGAARGGAPVRQLPDTLTQREIEVLTLIGQGLSNRAIARALFVSETTVKTHINHLFAKAGLADRGAAVALARACDLPAG